MRANAATATAARLVAAVATRNADALLAFPADDHETTHHPTGLVYDREGFLASFRTLLSAQGGTYRLEPLATLGDSLALCRQSVSGSGFAGQTFDVGAYEIEEISLIEVDARGQYHRVEFFAVDRLGDAVARLYERYADLLPDGPERTRAATTARSVAAYVGPFDPDRCAAAFAPGIEVVDHRILGTWSARGAEALLQHYRSMLELADDTAFREDEILGLQSDAFLVQRTFSGTDRASGGAFERQFIQLWTFGNDGLMTRLEYFDADRPAEALARFDELTVEPAAVRFAAAPSRAAEQRGRRVRANAATAAMARLEDGFAARDLGAVDALLADTTETVDHPEGATYGREGQLDSVKRMLRSRDLEFRLETLATLGESFCLARRRVTASGTAGGRFDVAEYETEHIVIAEVDERGRFQRYENFSTDRLGRAVSRLYERYADLLPDGPERARAAATARSVAAIAALDRIAEACAPSMEYVDRRSIVGLGHLRGAAVFDMIRIELELSPDLVNRMDDVLALRSDAFLARLTSVGTDRGGGAHERSFLALCIFGGDGLATHWEDFDDDRVDEAFARFDTLVPGAAEGQVAEPPPVRSIRRRVRPNTATANVARIDAAVAARDADALPALFAAACEFVEHTTRASYDREGVLQSLRSFLRARDPALRHEPLATLGDTLALCRVTYSASGLAGSRFDVGAYETERFDVIEVDAEGRQRRQESFALDRLGDAGVRLFERYADLLPDGPERVRAATMARSMAVYVGPEDLDRLAATLSPLMDYIDHRTIGMESTRGAEAFLRGARSLHEVADDVANRVDDVLALRPDAGLVRATNFGRDRAGGGAYERPFLALSVFGADGLLTRFEQFDADHDAEALARFDELTAEPAAAQVAGAPSWAAKKRERRVRANAATVAASRIEAATAARDADALPILAERVEVVDHPRGATYDRQGWLATWRSGLRARNLTYRQEPLATFGDSLALYRSSTSASGYAGRMFDVGAYESEEIVLTETDAQGRIGWQELFAPDRLGDAVARLYERYADLLPDGPERARAAATARSVAAMAAGPFDPDRYATALAPALEFVDHRTVIGIGSARGAAAYLDWLRTLFGVAADVITRLDDVLVLRPDAALVRRTTSGSDRVGGGSFERQLLQIWVFGTDGLITREEHFDVDREAEALARFDALTAGPATVRPARRRVRPNAATTYAARVDAAFAARDFEAIRSLIAEDSELIEHTTGATYDRQGELSSFRALLACEDPAFRQEPLATLGDSLALCRWSRSATGFAGGALDVGAFEMQDMLLVEVDALGRHIRGEIFAADRLGDAVTRLYERYADPLPDGPARARATATARAVAAVQGFDLDRFGAAITPAVEFVDHRSLGFPPTSGAEAYLRRIRSMTEVAYDVTTRVDDVLVLRSDAVLLSWTTSGTDRAGGGRFERPFFILWVFGPDGLVARNEMFDGDRDAEALARFDKLTAEPSAVRFAALTRVAEKLERRVRPNAATAHAARLDAVIAARDADALPALFADSVEVMDHAFGTTWDRQGALFSIRSLLGARDPTSRHEPLATLGDSLALCRWSTSAIAFAGGKFDVGPYERDEIALVEVDAEGRRRGIDLFPTARLGDAVARLYERYTHLLPDGPCRTRAAATARSVAALLGPFDLARYAPALAPAMEFVDHRLIGLESAHGAEAYLRVLRSLLEVADDIANRVDDVIGLRSDAFLVQWTNSGTDRASGGAYERQFLRLWVLGTDGLLTRLEFFDVDHVDEALARFDELTAEPAAARVAGVPSRAAERLERQVHANAATANVDRLEAAIAARDADALPALLADRVEVMDHTKGATYDRRGLLTTWRSLLKAQDPTLQHEHLATLGDSLVLSRVSLSASGFAGGTFDVGAYKKEELGLTEVDAQGRWRWAEVFAIDRLGDAVARLYERYTDLLPDGPARTRAAATARSVAAMLGPFDPDRYATAYAPAIESVDRRTLGTWSAQGAEALLQHHRVVLELADDVAMREDDVLDLRPDAFLTRRAHLGTARAGGGAYERPFLWLAVFGSDGLLTRNEIFDADCDDEALARFDELAAEPLRSAASVSRSVQRPQGRVRPNAATALAVRVDAVLAARDPDALLSLLSDEFEVLDHTTGVVYDGQGYLATCRVLLKAEHPSVGRETLATLGESLALYRESTSARGFVGRTFDVGAYEKVEIALSEVDAQGRHRRRELFATHRLGDAVARLYERYADLLPDGPARARAAATARSVAAGFGPPDLDRFATTYAPALEVVDHRILGTWSARGAEEWPQHNRSLLEVADDVAVREDDVLGLRSDAFLVRRTHLGTDRTGGGAYERLLLMLWIFGPDGLVTRIEYFDVDHEDDALARFDALATEPLATACITNAATRSRGRVREAWAARDWDRVAAVYAPGCRLIDRRTLMHLDLDRDGYLQSMRTIFEMSSSRFTANVLATRGERLLLSRVLLEGNDRDVGPSEVEWLAVDEVDDAGDRVATVNLDPDDLDGAYAELDRRYAAGEAAPYARTWETVQRFARAVAARDWEELASVFDPDLVLEDHRPIGFAPLRSRDEFVGSVRTLVDLAPDVTLRPDHVLALDDRGTLVVWRWTGSRDAGPFEIPVVAVWVLGPNGRIQRIDTYNPEQLDAARARFEAIRVGAARDPLAALARPNAASAAGDRWFAAFAARDWAAMRALCAPDAKFEDRRRLALVSGDVDWWIADAQRTASMRNTRLERRRVGTAGDRVTV
ncbi:MAG: nuclear transport factor 2 family protein, partial [Candidatus Binatia bacterium]